MIFASTACSCSGLSTVAVTPMAKRTSAAPSACSRSALRAFSRAMICELVGRRPFWFVANCALVSACATCCADFSGG
jgi:hypothetical protein